MLSTSRPVPPYNRRTFINQMTWNERMRSKGAGTKGAHNFYVGNRFWAEHKGEATERATNNITLARGINKLSRREIRKKYDRAEGAAVPFENRILSQLLFLSAYIRISNHTPRHRLLDFPFTELRLRNSLNASIGNKASMDTPKYFCRKLSVFRYYVRQITF